MKKKLWNDEYITFYDDGILGVCDGKSFISRMSPEETKELYLIMKNFFETSHNNDCTATAEIQPSPKSPNGDFVQS